MSSTLPKIQRSATGLNYWNEDGTKNTEYNNEYYHLKRSIDILCPFCDTCIKRASIARHQKNDSCARKSVLKEAMKTV